LIEPFLQSVEKKAFRIALMATKREQEALDILQNAMMKLVEKYSDRPEHELKPLFYTILQNQIKNWYRKEAQISKWFFWQKSAYDDDESSEHVADIEGVDERSPELDLSNQHMSEQLIQVLESLPVKQQQCFLLRSWEGLSVKETAEIMQCSEGTIKTHMSRASQKLLAAIERQEQGECTMTS